MATKKTKIPIVTEGIVDIFLEKTLAAKELYCTREEMIENNPLLVDLLGSYINTFPEEYHSFATSAVVFAYHVLKKQEEYDSGIEVNPNRNLN